MSKRIEELEAGCEQPESLGRSPCGVIAGGQVSYCDECEIRIEERKLAEKEFKEFLQWWYNIACYKSSFKDDIIEMKIKELDAEDIGEVKK